MDLVLAGVRPLSLFANRQKSAVITILTDARKAVGCKHIGHVFNARGSSREETFVSVTYPGKWLINYALRSYFAIDPVMAQPMRDAKPIILNEISICDSAVRGLVDDARRYGLGRSFVSFPVMPFSSHPGSVMFSFDMEYEQFIAYFESERENLRAAARDIHLSVLRVRGFSVSEPGKEALSSLEQASLNLLAEGTGFADAAERLGVSGVVFSAITKSACAKLGCHNVIHAVAKSIAYGLIEVDVGATRPRTAGVPSPAGSTTPH
ncbi:LuxR family transcriptional regulator [Hoeflea marina]|uniref:LuxR family transcriptional regulator n=1 Tax=Hoeflea marina TaxID=274592 RepID=A0A317PGT5_9HYPH|nr:LuxR family transcriptional regulator [Hoeflea marina]